jgi:hypothetical protein
MSVSPFLAPRCLLFLSRNRRNPLVCDASALVVGDDPEGLEAAFREALRSQGYIEGQNS